MQLVLFVSYCSDLPDDADEQQLVGDWPHKRGPLSVCGNEIPDSVRAGIVARVDLEYENWVDDVPVDFKAGEEEVSGAETHFTVITLDVAE